MRMSKFHDSDVTKEVINGPRSSPLRIHKDSHVIHKPSSPYASSNSHHHHQQVLENSGGGATKHHGGVSTAKRPPVIIYTQSPKIIHAQAHDFMTLVQKLTGLERAEEEKGDNLQKSDQSESTIDEGSISNDDKDCVAMINNNNNNNYYCYDVGYEENESSSGLTAEEKFVAQDSSAVSSMYNVRTNNINNPYLIDMPYFNPSSNDFLCSSSSRPNTMFGSASMANHHPISPSFMDFVKGLPDY